MNLLPFDKQKPYRARTFVPKTIDLGDWAQIAIDEDLDTVYLGVESATSN